MEESKRARRLQSGRERAEKDFMEKEKLREVIPVIFWGTGPDSSGVPRFRDAQGPYKMA